MPQNYFSQDYYRSILTQAYDAGYKTLTMHDFFTAEEIDDEKILILRHDVDAKPLRSTIFHEVETELGFKSSYFLLVHDINYNPFAVNVLKKFQEIAKYGCEIGLHTNYLETASILNQEPIVTLAQEVNALNSHFDITGIACHRNIDFLENALPHLEENWKQIQKELGIKYQAYEEDKMQQLTFVNEGLNPHLCWRNHKPEDVIESGANFCLSTHPHWWHKSHPFED